MEWRNRERSSNIEDRRRMGSGGVAGIGGIGALVIVLIGYFLGVDVTPLLQGAQGAGQISTSEGVELTPADEKAAEFVSVVLRDTEKLWTQVMPEQVGRAYQPVTLVLYKGMTRSECGGASAATGPFFCPIDKKIYLDTDFFATMEQQLGAKGDFAAAYVVAHEVGHHVQDLLGILEETTAYRQQVGEVEANQMSVRVELQADCFSGIWARYSQEILGIVQPGDLEEAVIAARQIGDDTLQRNAGRSVQPHTFTHGTSKQRMSWFAKGFESGDMSACDTFSTDAL